MSWKDDEAQMLTSLTLSVELPSTVCQCWALVQDAYLYGIFSPVTLWHIPTLIVSKLIFSRLTRIASTQAKFWVMFTLVQIFQIAIVAAELYTEESDFVVSFLVSTIGLMTGEISPAHSVLVNGVLFGKHLAVWVTVGRQKLGIQKTGLFSAAWGFYLIMMTQFLRRKMLIEKRNAERSTQVNELRLNAILQAIPDGVVVLSEQRKVIAYNQTLLLQMGLKRESGVEGKIAEKILKLRYDPEYATDTDKDIEEDIENFMKQKVASVTDFKPVNLNGAYLECRGCISQWDESNVCVLTIRDTSNWVTLEKKAKTDSANKTALLRSVSHELRTPTNSILNLAMDVKSAESLSSQGVKDIEILISATKFLMAIINDLLDFSRILHDNFSLSMRAFPLEPIIRECAQMIEPQCREKRLDFRVRYDCLLPVLATTDENRLKQVVLNFLSNAVK